MQNPTKFRHPEKANRPDTPVLRKPDWIRVKAPMSAEYGETRALMRKLGLNTVCEEAACPNIGECWKQKHATLMILGSVCTRACAFCNVATGRPDKLDPHEPAHVAEACAELKFNHIVITSVDRDDLEDGGAAHFAETIRRIRALTPATTIEVLTPDFLKKPGSIETVVEAAEVHRCLAAICAAFDLPVPALYRAKRPGRGCLFGQAGPAVVIAEDLPDDLAPDELAAVLAHQCGHLLLAGPWSDQAELSADRAAAAYLGDADAITRAIFRFVGGADSSELLAVRVREIQAWTATPGFDRVVARLSTVERGG